MKRIWSLLLLAPLGLALAMPAQAETEGSATGTTTRMEIKEVRQEERAKVRDLRQAWMGERCETLETRIDTVTNRFDNNKSRHVTEYQQLKERFQTLMKRLEAAGFDVSKLKSDATVLDEKIKKFASDYAAWTAQLKTARTSACGQSAGAFKTAMEKARELAKTVQADSQDIRTYYQTVIRPDIAAVRAQKGEK